MQLENVEDLYPLSPMQQGMIFHTLYDQTGAYFQQIVYTLEGRLDAEALRRAWQQVVDRHPALRSAFVWEALDTPLQVVRQHAPLPWAEHDWRGEPPERQRQRLDKLLAEQRQRGFELDACPLMDLTLLRTADARCWLVWNHHHLILDAWSTAIVLAEVFALYTGRSLKAALPFRDYIAWLQGQDLALAERYWRERLAGFASATPLPYDQAPGQRAADTAIWANQSLELPESLSGALRRLAQGQRLTLNTLLRGAWAILLGRHSGSADVLFGGTTSGRPAELPGVESIVGLFINTMPVRVRAPAEAELLPWLRALQAEQIQQERYAYSPLVEVQGWSAVPRGQPLFESLLVFENAPAGGAAQLADSGLAVSAIDYNGHTSYPLTLEIVPGAALFCNIQYDAARFAPDAVARLLGQLQTLLQGMADDPHRRLGDLPWMTEAEQRQVLLDWNTDRAPSDPPQCLHRLFEAQAARHPQRIAASCAGAALSYAELDRRANQLAHHLRSLGVGTESLVALYLDRSLDLPVAILAVLKAGGAYLPIDPDYPAGRVSFIIEDSRAGVLLTQRALLDRLEALPAAAGLRAVCLDDAEAEVAARPAEAPPVGVTADNLAYVIYTSGSTGQPKGSLITHSNASRLLLMTEGWFGFDQHDVWTLFHSIAFDFSVWELWGALAYGGRLVIVPYVVSRSPEEFYELLRAERVTVLNQTPSAFYQLVQVDRTQPAPLDLRLVIFGGEALNFANLRPWFERHGDACPQLVNMYGITETTVHVTYYPVTRADAEEARGSLIGRPIPDLQAYVLDARQRPVPVGVAGELYIGGAGLARGYGGRPGLTAERFVPNPFVAEGWGLGAGKQNGEPEHTDAANNSKLKTQNSKLYRTGDLARWREDGALEYLGRIDHQVKLRGFRVELGEIEATLLRHPAVATAAVLVREDAPGDRRLVAYLVPSPAGRALQQAADAGLAQELRAFLAAALPAYMIPAAYVLLDALPLTSNGKIDRRALPAPDSAALRAAREHQAARTPVEQTLAELWAELLCVPQPGVRDNFFELGGHSLLAMQLVSRVREAFEVDLPLRELFAAPTVAEQAALVEAALVGGDAAPIDNQPIPPVGHDGPLPLSFAQERLWFLDRLDPGSPLYNIPACVRLHGWLDVEALRRSFEQIIHRHAVLRTAFVEVDRRPVQRIAPPGPLALELRDLRGLPADRRDAAVRQAVAEEARRAFDLARGPLIVVRLLQHADDEFLLLVTMHHIVTDGWSIGVMTRELADCYAAFAAGRAPQLPDLPIQYADYAAWQRGWMEPTAPDGDSLLGRQSAYWKRQLAGLPAALELPTDRPRPPVQTASGASHRFAIPPGLTAALAALSQREGASLFMTLLAAWSVLLARYSGQRDIAVGTPTANRGRPETEPLIGCFINMLVLRTDLGGNPSFRELLARVRAMTLDAYEHQDLPFERLVEELKPPRDQSRTPLFQVLLVLQNAPMPVIELPGLTVQSQPPEAGIAKFDLELELVEVDGRLDALLDYNTDLFDAATVARMAAHFQTLLASAAADPDRPIEALDLLAPEERARLLTAGGPPARYDTRRGLHALAEEWARATPEAAAAVCQGEQICYVTLDRRAEHLAQILRAAGVGPERRVGICLDRSIEALVCVLAVWKAGGAYVPLDPEHPRERLAAMVADSRPLVTLSRAAWCAVLPSGVRTICLEELEHMPPAAAPAPPDRADGQQLAYVIYTSGSTGAPKGVMVEQGSLVNAALAWRDAYALRPGMRHLQMASFSFDVFVGDLARSLATGGTLVICPRETLLDPAALYSLIQREQIACGEFVPVVVRELLRYMQETGQTLPAVERLIVGSDLWHMDEYNQLRQRCGPDARLISSYGLSEATIDSTFFEAGGDHVSGRPVPIGRPFANTQTYVLDAALQPVPTGVVGELYIGGAGLARGYLNRSDLTAERFVPNPFADLRSTISDGRLPESVASKKESAENDKTIVHCKSEIIHASASRLYKTGDRARVLPDGNIEFLGRADAQIKLRGFRIEPGEIEAALRRHPALQEVLVLPWPVRDGDLQLVAYVVPAQPGVWLAAGDAAGGPVVLCPPAAFLQELRAFLGAALPSHMIPAATVALAALPLTPSGKLDRRALPPPDGAALLGAGYVAPSTPAEQALVAIWAEVLRVERVGVHDDFFALGGHSLLATQVISRVKSALGVEVPLRALFERPTVAGLAAALAPAPAASPAAPIRPAPRDRPLPLSFSQQRLWFLDQFEPGTPAFNLVSSVRLTGALDLPALRHTLREILRRHESLRTVFASQDGQPFQVILAPGDAELSEHNLQPLDPRAREQRVRELILAEGEHRFDLARGPLFRCLLLRLAPQEHILCLNIHHIVFDGWSEGVLLRELTALYAAFRAGRPAPLEEPALQYADYAVWQRALLQGQELERQLAYWRRQLGGADGPLNLPTDRPRPPVRTSSGAVLPFVLGPEQAQELRALAAANGVSLFVVLLAALKTLLHRYTSDQQIGVGTYIANRNHQAVEPLVGFFVNTLVLRTDLSGVPTFRELLARVREVALGAYEHQDLPFEQLLEELTPPRDLSRTPLFQVMLTLQNTPLDAVELPDLAVEPLDLREHIHAQFDLTVWLQEQDAQLLGALEYNTDLFDRATVERMAAHLHNLLARIVADPDQPIDTLDLLSPRERAGLLAGGPAADYPADRPLHLLVQEWAARTPHAPAAVWGDQRLTYAELDRRAERLAGALSALGVGPERRVAICVERSLETVVCVLAVWKAGGAYVPLDPEYPPERLALMLRDSAPQVLLTTQALAATLPPTDGAVLCLDTPERWPEGRPTAPACGSNLAYIIYTSGSTSTPKGVMVEHRSLANAFYAWRDAYGLRPGMRHLQMASFSFDVCAGDMVRALCSGGALVICPRELLLDPARLHALIQRERPDCAEFVPAVVRELLRYLKATGQILTHPQLLIVGSDTWLMDEYRQLQASCGPDTRVVNSYGLSEATIDSTFFAGGAPELSADRVVPIGRPFANTEVYILDRHQAPVPPGVVGELYIGGAGLARGYGGRPDLTAERFVPNPFGAGGWGHPAREENREPRTENRERGTQNSKLKTHSSGEWGGSETPSPQPLVPSPRLYKTGDLARWLPDGAVEFLGRNDRQVKIRGFRIELGEIQAALAQHPHVAEALVTVRSERAGGDQLIAYLVPAEEPRSKNQEPRAEDAERKTQTSQLNTPETPAGEELKTQTSKLKTYLRGRLPEHMVPAWFVWLDAFPLTPNGKIDLAALPAPDHGARDVAETFVPPRDTVEVQLAAIWEEILNIAPVGVQDSFFDLGGHSLLAVHLMARIQQRFQAQLPLNALFGGATIEHLAALLRGGADGPVWSPLVPIQSRGDKAPLFCVPGAGGNVIGFYGLARRLGADRPIYGLQARGLDGETAPHTSVEAMAAEYVAAIRQVQPEGPYLLCGHSFGGWVAFEVAQQLQRQGQPIGLLAIVNTPTPMLMRDAGPSEAQDNTTVLLNVARSIERTFGRSLDLTREQVQHLESDEQITLLTEALKRVEILPPEAATGQVRGFVNVFKVNYQIIYLPQDWQPVPIVLLRAAEQHAEDDDMPLAIRHDPAWGWGELAAGPVAVHMVPGEHLTVLAEPHVGTLAEQLARHLE